MSAGHPMSTDRREVIRQTYEQTRSVAETMRLTGHSKAAVWKYGKRVVEATALDPVVVATFDGKSQPGVQASAALAPHVSPRLPDPAPEAGGPQFPEPLELDYQPFRMAAPGTYLILSDCHIPYHDRATIQLAIEEARRRQVVGVLLNGDILDCAELSDHERDVDAIDLADEITLGRQLVAWIRSRLPAARLVMKQGNHEARLHRVILRDAPALMGIEGVDMPSFLKLADYGVEWVADQRIVTLGKLNVIHGNEYRGSGGVNPARWLYLKARSVALCGHFHRSSEHHSRDIGDNHEAAWSVGCACHLHPRWLRLNDWNLGFAFVSVEADGWFVVENKRVLNGRVV